MSNRVSSLSKSDCTGRPGNSGNKRLPRSPRGVPWLPKAADLASKFHREPPWRRPTRLVPVGSEIPDVLCFRYFCRTVRVDPATLGTNDYHGHQEGSLGYPRPPTLPQNSIGSLRGDVRPDLCQSEMIRNETGKRRGTPFGPWDLSAISKEK
ncbi:hypothetical protein CRG98_000754 [Punica granatum]|uniref:Uncharacterized protein n=1 Tax=Punica granatum TaxID=22663 RepID=A0A2I0LDY6_PUNGR|nr:hypothetical protein CRG98_000754 [Punica granatum]